MCDKTVQRHNNSRTITPSSLTMLLFGENSCGKYHRHKRNKHKIATTDKSDSDASDNVLSSLSVVTKPSSSQPMASNRCRSFIKTPYQPTWHSRCCVVVCILLALLTIQTECANGLLMDSSAINGDGDVNFGVSGNGGAGSGNSGGLYLDKIGNLEKSIAAVFNKVAYGSTTTKRSIPDNVFVPSLTTVPTPPLTTYRYVLYHYQPCNHSTNARCSIYFSGIVIVRRSPKTTRTIINNKSIFIIATTNLIWNGTMHCQRQRRMPTY